MNEVKEYLAAIGRRGGQAGRGKSKARSKAQAKAAAMARWRKNTLKSIAAFERKSKRANLVVGKAANEKVQR